MPMPDRPADRIRKMVAMAASEETAETRSAKEMARKQIAGLDTELLDTLAGQRERLLEELRHEAKRLNSSRGRATKTETGALVSSALVLLQHYERVDALISAVLLLRIEGGHQLTNEERQQLEGPVENTLDKWMKAGNERRRTEREERRTESRRRRHEAAQ